MKTGRRDWTGNSQAAFVTFGAEGHATHERAAYDYYATEPRAVELLLEQEQGVDFLTCNTSFMDIPYDIITNPPYKYSTEFAEKALELVADGRKVAMFLKLTFMESKKRKPFFQKYPPRIIYVSAGRLMCGFNGEFKTHSGRAIAYAWYVWEKGFNDDPVIRWIN